MRKILPIVVVVLSVALLGGCGIRRNKYETKIDNNSQQPDKTLFDRAVNDIEKSRYEVARLTLQTLINTYPDSEYLAKAKLAIADAWYRQGGTASLAQAEAEYKDFITFFPNMPEAGEAQLKVAMIHYQQMEKPDRDATHARRAEDEFKQLLLQFPDSPFKEEAEQRLREVQEVLAQHEFSVGRQYYTKTNYRAAVPRLKDLTTNYPNFSEADQALWLMGQSYEHAGKNFRQQSAAAYGKIISDYPLSPLVDKAKEKLTDWKMPVPEAKPEAYARMKYDLEHREEKGLLGRTWGIFNHHPDVTMASKSGAPVLVSTPQNAEEQPAAQPNAEPGTISIQAVPVSNDPAQPPAVQPAQPQNPQPVAPPQPVPQAPEATPQQQAPATTTPATTPPAAPKPGDTASTATGNSVQVAADTKTSTDAASDNSQASQLSTGRERKHKKSKKEKKEDKKKDEGK